LRHSYLTEDLQNFGSLVSLFVGLQIGSHFPPIAQKSDQFQKSEIDLLQNYSKPSDWGAHAQMRLHIERHWRSKKPVSEPRWRLTCFWW